MNQKFQYILIVFLSIGLFAAIFRKCKPTEKIIYEITAPDNRYHDSISESYQSKQLVLLDSIDRLNKRTTAAKIIFKYKYKEITKDSLISDLNCLETLEVANQTIEQMDSLITLQFRGLESCRVQGDNLRTQIELNKNMVKFLESKNELLETENSKLKKVRRFKYCF